MYYNYNPCWYPQNSTYHVPQIPFPQLNQPNLSTSSRLESDGRDLTACLFERLDAIRDMLQMSSRASVNSNNFGRDMENISCGFLQTKTNATQMGCSMLQPDFTKTSCPKGTFNEANCWNNMNQEIDEVIGSHPPPLNNFNRNNPYSVMFNPNARRRQNFKSRPCRCCPSTNFYYSLPKSGSTPTHDSNKSIPQNIASKLSVPSKKSSSESTGDSNSESDDSEEK